jgi:lipopolysaccharide/colanic/teichoic acid biosynthesis glycosyltransferase
MGGIAMKKWWIVFPGKGVAGGQSRASLRLQTTGAPHTDARIRRRGNSTSWRTVRVKIKRWIDIGGAAAGLLLLSPLILLIAVVIKISSPGPVFFRQQRVGLKGNVFRVFKFRTMLEDCEDEVHRNYLGLLIRGERQGSSCETVQRPMHKIEDDRRITAIGRVLRIWSLDELPQLVNVLKGEMSLVGPRPAIPYEVENYLPWHKQRFEVLPGVTGLWQVSGRNTMTFDEMVSLDIQYIASWSLWLDLKILCQTIPAVLCRNGAA